MDVLAYKVLTVLVSSCIYAPLALSLGTAFRIARFPDLTVEGTFMFAAVVYHSLVTAGWMPLAAGLAAVMVGGLAGGVTGLAHFTFRVPSILAGILTWMTLYSLGLVVLGRPNARIVAEGVITPATGDVSLLRSGLTPLLVLGPVLAVAVVGAWIVLESRSGLKIRAAGSNAVMARSLGIRPGVYVTLGLVLGNGLAALAGVAFAAANGYVDVNMGVGMLIAGVSALFLGMAVFPSASTASVIGASLVGALMLRTAVAGVFELGMPPAYLRALLAGLLLLGVLAARLRRRGTAEQGDLVPIR